MKSIVIFDSNFGNTKQVAETIARELGEESAAILVSEVSDSDVSAVDFLVVGSPIIGWKPSEKMGIFLAGLMPDQLKGKQAASFDTRVNLFIHGDASKKIANALSDAGAKIIDKPHWFIVKGKEGPLVEGELDRSIAWAASLKKLLS